jgi:fermentation-respiration switch protein FrsA (DUF1100 family)
MDDEAVRVSLAVLERIQAGRFADVVEMFLPALRPLVSADVLDAAWNAVIVEQGALVRPGLPAVDPPRPGVTVVRVPLEFAHGEAVLVVSVATGGRLAGVQLAPARGPAKPWQPPPYADRDRFEESELALGSDPWAVPATLTLPRGATGCPAVVLLAGSGPQDRDETLGPNKPFKDLAWGLASRGVAVLRFDKVTLTHPDLVRRNPRFTVLDEYQDAVQAAVGLLRNLPHVDAARIVLLGHSLGGTVAPRIAAADQRVGGLVLAAAGSVPLQWAIVRQLRYLAELDPRLSEASREMLEAAERQASRVDAQDLTWDTPASELPMGVPAAYWLDLRAYDPVETARSLAKPLFLAQGGRDYQVTVEEDFARWREGLAGRPGVRIALYPSDNHLFFPGSGPSTPAEYDVLQHVDRTLVDDVAAWVKELPEVRNP